MAMMGERTVRQEALFYGFGPTAGFDSIVLKKSNAGTGPAIWRNVGS
jgi:hypothetical protein